MSPYSHSSHLSHFSHSAFSAFRIPHSAFLLVLALALLLSPPPARAIQTPEVEIGNGGAYDGTVKLTRDDQGRLLLRDNEVPSPVTLNDLRYAGRDHGLLLGLGDDDHPQYQTDARHAAVHSAAFNGALATPPDAHGNATLGAHLADAAIHPNAQGTMNITGNWTFAKLLALSGGLDLTGGGLSIAGAEALSPARAATLTQATIDNLQLDGNTLSTTNANGDLNLTPNGAGAVVASRLWVGPDGGGLGREFRINSGVAGTFLRFFTNADGGLGFQASGVGTFFWTYPWSLYNTSGNEIGFTTGANQDFWASAGGLVRFRDRDAAGADRVTIDTATGDINTLAGAYKTGGVTRLSAAGAATLTQADVDNLRLDGNTLASTNTNGDLTLAPNGTGKVVVNADLAVGSGGSKITLNGERLMNEVNLLDNPDFTIWQRGTAQRCASGGNAGGTLLWPVPGTLTTCADRWQISRAKNDTATTISRATPPGSLPTALYCLKNEYISGAAPVNQYLHQTLSREQTAALRGKWVTFAVSHYMPGASGGTLGIYKVIGGTPTALATFSFTSTANTWERVAVAAQVPADAEVLLVSIQSNLAAGGPTVAYVANAALVEGKYVGTTEKAGDPAASSIPPLPRPPAEDLAQCQRYYEKGAFATTFYAPDDSPGYYSQTFAFNTAKAAASTITLNDLDTGLLNNVTSSLTPQPAYLPGQSWTQGFQFQLSGTASYPGNLRINATWTAVCPEPI